MALCIKTVSKLRANFKTRSNFSRRVLYVEPSKYFIKNTIFFEVPSKFATFPAVHFRPTEPQSLTQNWFLRLPSSCALQKGGGIRGASLSCRTAYRISLVPGRRAA